MQRMNRKAAGLAALAMVLALSGCLSLGKKTPDQLLNLTATSAPAAGAAASGSSDTALAVLDLQAPLKLDVTRVPVDVAGSSVAYLKDAEWVERPARLFTRLLSDTIRAKGNRLVVTGSDVEDAAATKLSGTLAAMDYDASRGTAVVRYDAVLQTADGKIQTRRFESEVSGVAAAAGPVGVALNQAANQVAAQVAEWVG
jgi:cholesterol transport system auxiliary component